MASECITCAECRYYRLPYDESGFGVCYHISEGSIGSTTTLIPHSKKYKKHNRYHFIHTPPEFGCNLGERRTFEMGDQVFFALITDRHDVGVRKYHRKIGTVEADQHGGKRIPVSFGGDTWWLYPKYLRKTDSEYIPKLSNRTIEEARV